MPGLAVRHLWSRGAAHQPIGSHRLFPEARISGVLSSLAGHSGERLTVADIVSVLRDRAFALLVVLLGLPNCLPMPPPIPLICGMLLTLVAAQIAAGSSTPWLPRALLGRSIPKDAVQKAVGRALPILQKLERFSRPRMAFLESPLALRVVGFLLIAFALGLLVAAYGVEKFDDPAQEPLAGHV